MSTAPFDPVRALSTLARHGVEFIVIGGVAVRMYGSPRVTNDTDVCYERSPANLERLADALRAMHARRIGDLDPQGIAVDITRSYLEAEDMFAFMTDFGQLDLIAAPQGVRGFEDLRDEAMEVDIGPATVRLASIAALKEMKRARGWSVDRMDLAVLDNVEREGGAGEGPPGS